MYSSTPSPFCWSLNKLARDKNSKHELCYWVACIVLPERIIHRIRKGSAELQHEQISLFCPYLITGPLEGKRDERCSFGAQTHHLNLHGDLTCLTFLFCYYKRETQEQGSVIKLQLGELKTEALRWMGEKKWVMVTKHVMCSWESIQISTNLSSQWHLSSLLLSTRRISLRGSLTFWEPSVFTLLQRVTCECRNLHTVYASGARRCFAKLSLA